MINLIQSEAELSLNEGLGMVKACAHLCRQSTLNVLCCLQHNNHPLKDRQGLLKEISNDGRTRVVSEITQAHENRMKLRLESDAEAWILVFHGCIISTKVMKIPTYAA